MSTEKKTARVKIENESSLVVVPISSDKPEIPDTIIEKWQKFIDLIGCIMNVPTSLITRFTSDELQILVASNDPRNPYKRNDSDKLGIGMFCENVVGRRAAMKVSDSRKSEYWSRNPHAGLGMISYIGMPIEWNDGEVFGTFCLLDDKANEFSGFFDAMLKEFKAIVEADLEYILLVKELEAKVSAKDFLIREIHHRIKNHFNLLISYINLNLEEGRHGGDFQEIMNDIQDRVYAISLIHEKLYQNNEAEELSLPEYLRQLCGHFLRAHSCGNVEVRYEIDDVRLSLEKSVPLALILSELVTNSIKHAFEGREKPFIEIRIRLLPGDILAFSYRDNGRGLPDGFSPEKSKTLGMVLVRGFVNQIGGSLRTENNGEALFSFTFPLGPERLTD